ncbi:MAG: bifunctional (p)ppGpp synthetase/guanosine-3',5'-bis(diphosphate) 3'-pyrophosphohydrolase [Myxococcota bacterium]
MGDVVDPACSLSSIVDQIRSYSPDADVKPVMTAYLLAARAHAGQTRKTGEAYLTHPLAVAQILADLRMDVETIATALLHDALEDNPISKEEMESEIGPEITELVDGVTKIGKLKFRSHEELAAENFRKMMLAMSRDLRVILVKLADRLHNMSTLGGHGNEEKQRQIARETQEIYVPIANRLGLTKIKDQLEDFCMQVLHPTEYAAVLRFLDDTQSDRERYIDRVVDALKAGLDGHGIPCAIRGRAKHPASIFRKMDRQQVGPDEVPDLLAFRIIANDVGACYLVLGLIHASFPPVPDRIKDYIARPKPNGYQSLHTTLIGPENRRVEIQIRTPEMERIAEDGIAAHWQYKEGHLRLTPDEVIQIAKIRDLFDAAREAEDATDFMEAVKVEFYADEVFVFTPKGDVKRFPLGATTLDFAYAVHTDVGHRCTGAKINGRMVPLRYQLQSGDTVEILTSENQRPSRDWCLVARTGRAIQKIRRYLRQEEREQGLRLGRDMIEAELKRCGWSLQRVTKEGLLKEALKKRGYKDLEPLLVEVAQGNVVLASIVKDMLPEGVFQAREAEGGALTSLLNRFRRTTTSPVLITGEDGLLVTFAKCCQPLPGEPVVGFITRGRGITVHRGGCAQLGGMDPERHIPVEWDGAAQTKHNGEIRIYCTDRPGMLAKITKICEQNGVNINRAEAVASSDSPSVVTLNLELRDVSELTRLISNIEKVPGVEAVTRTMG